MKSTSLIALLFALSINASAQYASTLNDGNTWLGRFYGWSVTDYRYVIDGDSMTMNTFYKKLYAYHNDSNESTFTALLREDVNEGKIYRYDGEGVEVLLYDYSLDAGESTTIHAMGMDYEVTIDSVTTITIDGEERRKLYFSDAGRFAFWIEGVGSCYGINDPALAFSADYDPILFCFYKENLLNWTSFPDSFQCLDVLSIDDNDHDYSIEVWPNPFSNHINLSFAGNISNGVVTITSTTGTLIDQQSISSLGRSKTLNLSHLNNGVYLLSITDSNGQRFTKQIIKLS